MKKKWAFLVAMCFATVFTASVFALEIGDMAPDFTLKDMNGKEVTLSSYTKKKQIIVLEWFNHDCPFVKKFYGANKMQELQKQYTNQEVIWLSINSSATGNEGHRTMDALTTEAKAKGMQSTAVLIDEKGLVGKLYVAKTTPHMFVINKEGKIAYQGAIDSIKSTNAADIKKADNYVVKALDSLKAGRAIAMEKTDAYGCSVKYK